MMLAQIHDDRIPILVKIVETRGQASHDLFLSKPSTTLYQLVMKIKKKLAVSPRHTVYLFCRGRMLSPQAFLSKLYESHKAEDGFLYIEVASTPSLGRNRL